MRTLVILLVFLASALHAQPYSIRLHHEATPNEHILVDVRESDGGRVFLFSHCIASKECTRIGRYDAYDRTHLLELEQLWRFTGRVVFGVEAAIVAASTFSIAWYARGHRNFVDAVKVSAGQKPAQHSQSLPARTSYASASLGVAMPEVQAMPQLQAQPQAAPEDLSESMGYVARLLGWCYSTLAGPAIGIAFWEVKGEITSRFQEVVLLSLRFLSPAEHLRAATLLYDITHAKCDLYYSSRPHASILEYLNQYLPRDLKHLVTKLEDALAVTPH